MEAGNRMEARRKGLAENSPILTHVGLEPKGLKLESNRQGSSWTQIKLGPKRL